MLKSFTLLLAAPALVLGCARARPAPTPSPASTQAPAAAARLAPEGVRPLMGTPAAFTAHCDEQLARARESLSRLGTLDGRAAAQEVLETYDTLTGHLLNTSSVASLARNAHPDPALRAAAETCEQDVEKLNTEVMLSRPLYDALTNVDLRAEDDATRTWIERSLRELRREGVDRDEPTRAKVRALKEELTLLGQDFGRNIREDVRFVELAPAQLEGLPEDYRRAHPAGANGKVRISSDTPDYAPFMAYAKDGKAREQLWSAYRMRGHPKNVDVLARLLAKRQELATLLGYPNWAAYATETKMVRSEKAAADFIEKVNRAAEPAARRDAAQLLALKRKDVPRARALEPWEFEYYEDKAKAQLGFDSQAVRPYLEYSRVLAGVLDVTSQLFGIRYEKVPGAPVWHPDVASYDVYGQEGLLGRVHLDMHPRADKYKHAAQYDLVLGQAGKALPEGVLLCNFPRPGAEPALMQPREVETFFHEFGHLLHHVLGGQQRWVAQSGVRTEWDFVEAPSMMLQEWASRGEALQRFARHYQTGEPIPEDLVKRMVAAKDFGRGLYTRRQMYLAALSLEAHRGTRADVLALATALQPRFEPFRKEMTKGTYFPLSFDHLDGYSALYYTYIWSSVIARDFLGVFEKEGFLNAEPAARYRTAVLAPGGSKDAALLARDFLGRDFSFEAYARWLNGEAP